MNNTDMVSIQLSEDHISWLHDSAARRGITFDEALRRCIHILDFVETQISKGSTLLVENSSGCIRIVNIK